MKRTRKGRLARRALSLLFALTLLWECGALTPKARAADVVAADGTVNFVLWQDVSVSNVQGNLEKYCSGGDAEHPYTAYTDSYGDLVFHIADRDASSADAERWTAASPDELVVTVAEVRAAEDGVDVRLRAHVNGEARVTVSSEAANVTYTLTVTSDSGAPRLRECVWSAYAPPSPFTEEELDALLSGVADSLRNLEIAAEP